MYIYIYIYIYTHTYIHIVLLSSLLLCIISIMRINNDMFMDFAGVGNKHNTTTNSILTTNIIRIISMFSMVILMIYLFGRTSRESVKVMILIVHGTNDDDDYDYDYDDNNVN